MLLKLLTHSSGCCQGLLFGFLLCAVLSCRGRRRHSNAEVNLTVEKGVHVSCIFFLCELGEVLAVTRFEILRVRVLEPLGEPAFLVSF